MHISYILIRKSNLLFILLLLSSITVTSFFSKQAWAIDSTSIINKAIETGLPLLYDFFNDRLDGKQSDDDTSLPNVESSTTGSMNDPCADPTLGDLCGSAVPNDPCADPTLGDLCGSAVPNDPCADPTLGDLCGSEQSTLPYDPYASPYDPQLAMQQYWAQFESQLDYLAPEDKETVLSALRQMIEQGLEPYSPVQQQEAKQILSKRCHQSCRRCYYLHNEGSCG